LSVGVAIAFAAFVVVTCCHVGAIGYASRCAATAGFGHVVADAEGGSMFAAIGLFVVHLMMFITNERDFPVPSKPRPVRVAVNGN
jgi:hypothetical protein